ncbi:MAG TPA: hypothetical protein DDZ80_19890 [Cyanobacteria bacterium UBA8803]|nr:hypothetical protein [Cyanobacteria bacterium UBA9273]HBL60627.1 hypothetical protein [Cyanobacteria bacterium UBA8803]
MRYQKLGKTQTAFAQPQAKKHESVSQPHHPLEQFQSVIGNRAVNQLLASQPILQAKPLFGGLSRELRSPIQTKLIIGETGDKYEQEADRIAKQTVSQMNAPETSGIQRQEITGKKDDKELRMQSVQHLPDGNEMAATPEVETSIRQESGNGKPLDPSVRTKMEPLMGVDLSQVSVHTNSQADRLNCQLNSRAFTWDKHIFFKQGEYNPSTQPGQELIAHESAHVVQQTGKGVPNSQRTQNATEALSINTMPIAASQLLQRRVLTIGNARAEKEVGKGSIYAGEAEGEGSKFLEEEQQQVIAENAENETQEEFHSIRDKWGDRALESGYNYFHPKRRAARQQGTHRFGPRQSFYPTHKEKYLKSMGEGEDLKIIAHGNGEKVGGYTPSKLVRLLIVLGFKPKHKGIIWLRGCLAAYQPPRRFGSNAGTSFIEKMDRELRREGYTNEVYGLQNIAMSGTLEEEYNPEKYAAYQAAPPNTITKERLKPRKRDRIWYRANPYGPVDDTSQDDW